jgi:hypothetical protein
MLIDSRVLEIPESDSVVADENGVVGRVPSS